MPARNPRILVTEDAPSYGVLAGLRALRSAGYEPWVAVTGRDAYSRRSRACAGVVTVPDPSVDRDAYAAALARASSGLDVAAVMPGTELGLVALSMSAEAFPPGIALGTCDPDAVRRATDKLQLEQLAIDAGLATPPSRHIRHSELESRVEVPLPAIVKAARTRTPTADGGFASSFAQRVVNRRELLDAVAKVPGEVALIQPALEGELRASCGVAWGGEVVAIVHQAARRIYPPGCGITAFADTVPPDPPVESGVRRLIAALEWSGIFQVQFVHSAGVSYLIDINPRIYGSLRLAVAAGLNLPAIWADLLLGRTPRNGNYRVGAHFRSEERDFALLGMSVLARDWSTVIDVLRPRRGTTHALCSQTDPLPLLLGGRMARIRRGHARVHN